MEEPEYTYGYFIINQQKNVHEAGHDISNIKSHATKAIEIAPIQTGHNTIFNSSIPTHVIKQPAEDRPSFINEVYFLNKLKKQPHIIHMVSFTINPQRMVLDKYDGNLEMLRQQPSLQSHYYIPHWENMRIQCIQAILAVHKLKIIHRDIKLENFLYRRQGEKFDIVLTDFELAIDDIPNSNKKLMIGTDGYRAPEMFCGVMNYTNKVDWYAFGIMWLQILNPEFHKAIHQLLMVKERFRLAYDIKVHKLLFKLDIKILKDINPNLPDRQYDNILNYAKDITTFTTVSDVYKKLCASVAAQRYGDKEMAASISKVQDSSGFIEALRSFISFRI